MKLSNRLSLVVTCVSAAALLGSFVAVYLSVDFDERKELDLALMVQAQAFAQRTALDDPGAALEGVASVPESLRSHPHYLAVYERDGKVLSATQNLAGHVPALEQLDLRSPLPEEGESFDLQVGGVSLRAVAVPVGGGRHTLVYAVSSRSLDKDAEFLRRILALLFCTALLFIWLISRWLGDRLAQDVYAIARVARHVATGDFGVRVGAAARGSEETTALAADLDQMIEQLGQLVESQRVFVSHAAHELRSPLSTLRGELQLALRRSRDAEAYRHTITNVLSDVEALIRLAEDLLSLARAQAEAGGSQTVAVAEVVEDALRMAEGMATQRGVRLEAAPLDAELGRRRARGVRNDVARALRNLIDNAVAHSAKDDVVLVRARVVDDRVELAVEDRGPGVTAGDTERIFEPFYRSASDQGENRSGAGLGLPIAQQIAQTSGGDVRLDPAYDPGARFVLVLPLAPAELG